MKNLKKIAKEKNITLTALSVKLGVSKEAISKYINGKIYPKTKTLIEMSKIFNVSTDYLLDLTDNPNKADFKLNEKEKNILNNYQTLNNESKLKAESYLQALNDLEK